MTKKIKKENLEEKGSMSIADGLKEAGKISNKDTTFISAYLRHLRKEFIVQSLELRTAATNIDTLCGELNALRVMVDRLFMNQESIKVGEKLFVHGSWEIPLGSKVRNAFDEIEKKTIASLFDNTKDIKRSEHAGELTKAIEKALEEQKKLLAWQNKRLREQNAEMERAIERAKGKNEAVKELEKALHQGTGHVSIKEEEKKK